MKTKKLLALVLVLVMVLCALPVVFAAEVPDAGTEDSDIDLEIDDIPAVEDVVYGDATGDGTVNSLDAVRILRYLAGWDVAVSEDAADATGDGTVNSLDAVRILRYLAGWDVVLGPAA